MTELENYKKVVEEALVHSLLKIVATLSLIDRNTEWAEMNLRQAKAELVNLLETTKCPS